MNHIRPALRRVFILTVAVVAIGSNPANGQTDASSSIPLIVIDSVPLTDAIRNLARQGRMNLILDPKLSGSFVGPDGKFVRQPEINARWENLTARQALERLLTEQKLVLIESPATTVVRITFADRGAKAVEASHVIGDTNKLVPLMILDDVPLGAALSQLARGAGLNVELDPTLSGAAMDSRGRMTPQPTVSLRWEQLSSAQALAAVLDAYDLQMVKDATGDKFRISPKAKTDIKPDSSEKAQKPAAEK